MVTTAAPPEPATLRFDVLDALRGICALLVVLVHFRSNGYIAQLPVLRNGWLFVDYFFVLSGFVIAHSYGARLTSGEVSIRRFMGLRMGRIYPLHIFVLLAFLALEMVLVLGGDFVARYVSREPFTGARGLESLAQAIFLVQTFGVAKAWAWNAPAWSIASEMWTYFLFAFVFVIAKRHVPLVSVVLALVAGAAVMSYAPNLDVTFDGGVLRCIFGFGLGVATYHAFRRFGTVGGSASELAVLALTVVFASLADGMATFLAPFVFALMIFVLASQRGVVSRVLGAKPFQFLGLTSYSIYMIHVFIQGRLGEVLQITKIVKMKVDAQGRTTLVDDPLVSDLVTLVMLALVIVGAWVTYRLVEVPGRDLSRRLLARPRAAEAPQVSA